MVAGIGVAGRSVALFPWGAAQPEFERSKFRKAEAQMLAQGIGGCYNWEPPIWGTTSLLTGLFERPSGRVSRLGHLFHWGLLAERTV
jgi:hypothetical protein